MTQRNAADANINRLSISLIVLTFLFASLRFFIRAKSKAAFGKDDIWLLFSLITFYTSIGILLWANVHGYIIYDTDSYEKTSRLLVNAKLQYAVSPVVISATATAKLSILCLYRRIFFITETFRRDSLIVSIGVFGYWIASILASLLKCTPVRGSWRIDVPSSCIDYAASFLGLELVNCLLDLAILYLPLRVISGLHLPLKRRIELAIVFTMGSLVSIIGVVRMALTYRAGSKTLSFTPNVMTANIENGIAIICACLPLCAPVLSRSTYSSLEPWIKKLGARLSRSNRCSESGSDDKEQLRGKESREQSSGDAASFTKVDAAIATMDNAAFPNEISSGTRSFKEFGDIV